MIMEEKLSSRERIDLFLQTFRQLESKVISLARISSTSHVPFSKALSEVYYNHLDPIISDYDNYDFLKTASDIRNILSHENNACVPSSAFLSKFVKITKSIVNPLSCYEIATKNIYSCKMDTVMKEVINIMDSYYLSHLPVLDKNKILIGVFSRSTLFDYLFKHDEIKGLRNMKVADFNEYLAIETHSNENYLFVAKKEPITSVFSALYKKDENHKKTSLLIVTENGHKDEPVLGLITRVDLSKHK